MEENKILLEHHDCELFFNELTSTMNCRVIFY